MKSISKIGSLATKVNTWRKEPGRFRFFRVPFKISFVILIVKFEITR